MCKGVRRPLNSPFCDECKANMASKESISPKDEFRIFLQAFEEKLNQREIDLRVVEFVGKNFNQIVNAIIKDRKERGLSSKRYL
mgnify:CR=1 FL=1